MTETTKRASQMTMGQIEEILAGMDWTEIHKARVFSDFGAKVVLYTDGDFSVQDQGTYYRDSDEAGVISYVDCWGQGNIDRHDYYAGYWTEKEDGEFVDPNGKVYTEDEMLVEAIEVGDWDYREDIDAVLESVQQERDEA